MMKKYLEEKEKYKDYILMYRLGDFYEMFFDDAITVSKELDITLTGKDCGLDQRAPMCGVPYHAVDSYISRLVKKGYKVSVCEQIKDEVTDEVTERKITKIITPGTVTDPQILDETKNSYICAVYESNNSDEKVAICYSDITTGEFLFSSISNKQDDNLLNEIVKFNPAEIYICGNVNNFPAISTFLKKNDVFCTVTNADTSSFEFDNATKIIKEHLGKEYTDFNLGDRAKVSVLGGLVDYLYKTQLCDISHMKKIAFIENNHFMDIDWFTWRNLEIIESMRSNTKKGSLLSIIGLTQTPMGARLLTRFLQRPSTDISEILKRQSAVTDFYIHDEYRAELRSNLSSFRDLERLLSKVIYQTANPRDVKALGNTLLLLPEIKNNLNYFTTDYIVKLNSKINTLVGLAELIKNAVNDEPPITTRDGKVINPSFNKELSELNILLTDSKKILAEIEIKEKEKTGIKTLKIGYNKVFGYFIEVSKSFVSMVPDNYIRKQTLTTGERYITADLKDLESRILSAGESIIKIENQIFDGIKEAIIKEKDIIKEISDTIAEIDVYSAFAEVSKRNKYTCPLIVPDSPLEIKNGRHPVAEKSLKNEIFVANDTFLDCKSNMLSLITGPNMAGKSTYMRQVALIVIMAQIGCYVPAEYVKMPVVDKVFTRVGASDDLSSGQSTFMIEMNEVAYILKNATKNSLIIFDEIGRGTSTFDGMSIAQSVIEYVIKKIKAKTLFATHYHELTSLSNQFDEIKNYNIAAKRKNNEVVFLRKIVPGGCDDSYGIDVAKLAGIPAAVTSRAETIMHDLENQNGSDRIVDEKKSVDISDESDLFSNLRNQIISELKEIDITKLTPIEAINELFRLSNESKNIPE